MKKRIFYFIGPEKTGTTFIYELLRINFPDYLLYSQTKESFNLINRDNFDFEVKRIEDIDNDFCFSVEPIYASSDIALSQLEKLSLLYDVHVIISLREPLSRSVSHYKHLYNKGKINSVDEGKKNYPYFLINSDYDNIANLISHKLNNVYFLNFVNFKNNQLEFFRYFSLPLPNILVNDSNRINEELQPRFRFLIFLLNKFSILLKNSYFSFFFNSSIYHYLKKFFLYSGVKKVLTEDEIIFISNEISSFGSIIRNYSNDKVIFKYAKNLFSK